MHKSWNEKEGKKAASRRGRGSRTIRGNWKRGGEEGEQRSPPSRKLYNARRILQSNLVPPTTRLRITLMTWVNCHASRLESNRPATPLMPDFNKRLNPFSLLLPPPRPLPSSLQFPRGALLLPAFFNLRHHPPICLSPPLPFHRPNNPPDHPHSQPASKQADRVSLRHQKVRKLNWRNWIFHTGARNQMIPAVINLARKSEPVEERRTVDSWGGGGKGGRRRRDKRRPTSVAA